MNAGGATEVYLPAEPFRREIIRLWRREAFRMGLNDDALINMVEAGETMVDPRPKALRFLAPQLDMSNKLIRQYLDPQLEVVPFSTVDKALARYGESTLDDVYGTGTLEALSLAYDPKDPRPRCRECGNEMRVVAKRCGFCIADRSLAA